MSRNKGKGKLIAGRGVACQWSQPLIPAASFATTASKRNITTAAVPCTTRPTISRTTVTRGRAESLEERQGTPRGNSARLTRPPHTTTPTVSSRVCRARRKAACFLLQPPALNLLITRATRSRPSTSTTTSTVASSSKKRTNRHSKGRYELGSLEQHRQCLGSPSSPIVDDCWNTASWVAGHNRLGLLGHRFWCPSTVIIADRWGIVSTGVAHRGFLPECHLRNRRIIIVGSPEKRLSRSVPRTYLGFPGENALWNRRIIISDRLGLLEQAPGVAG